MSDNIEIDRDNYTLDELAQVLGVPAPEMAVILEEHGYHLPSEQSLVKLTEEDYRDLMEEPPLDVDPY